MRPDAGHDASGVESPLPLPVARSDVRQAERRRVPVLPKLHAGRRAGGQYRRRAARRNLELAKRCSECGGCTRPAGPARSISARAAAPRFRIRLWWREACCCTERRCAGCCPWSNGLTYFSRLPQQLSKAAQACAARLGTGADQRSAAGAASGSERIQQLVLGVVARPHALHDLRHRPLQHLERTAAGSNRSRTPDDTAGRIPRSRASGESSSFSFLAPRFAQHRALEQPQQVGARRARCRPTHQNAQLNDI